MHVHASQMNPYVAQDAVQSAKTAANREAEITRRKLMESASEVAAESDLGEALVLKVEARKEPQQQPKQRNRQSQQNRQTQKEPPGPERASNHISAWA
jgi:hypothetical protein